MEERNISLIASTIDPDHSQDSFRYSPDAQGNEILIMTIDIGDGRNDEITVYENDKPEVLAEQFCSRHNMSYEIREVLAQQIKMNIDLIYQEEDQSTSNDQVNNDSIDKPEPLQNLLNSNK